MEIGSYIIYFPLYFITFRQQWKMFKSCRG